MKAPWRLEERIFTILKNMKITKTVKNGLKRCKLQNKFTTNKQNHKIRTLRMIYMIYMIYVKNDIYDIQLSFFQNSRFWMF